MREETKINLYCTFVSVIIALSGCISLVDCIKNSLPFAGEDFKTWIASIFVTGVGLGLLVWFLSCLISERKKG